MAQVERVGHDKRGNATFKRDDDGREILLDDKKIPDDETAEVAKIYHAWKKKLHVDTAVKFCAVKLSDVQARGLRLEAAFFDADALNARQTVMNHSVPFSALAAAYMCGRSKVILIDKSDFPIYQANAITDIAPKPSGYAAKNNMAGLFDYLRVHEGHRFNFAFGNGRQNCLCIKDTRQKNFYTRLDENRREK